MYKGLLFIIFIAKNVEPDTLKYTLLNKLISIEDKWLLPKVNN